MQPLAPQELNDTPKGRLSALLGAFAAEIAQDAPELADLIRAWPELPEPIRAAIAAMVKAGQDHSRDLARQADARGRLP